MNASEQDFAQCLKALLKEKKISASELARTMGYKSRNTIFRILDGEGAHGARLAFFARLREENPLGLDEAAFAGLEQALEISRLGLAAYRNNLAMRELLTGANRETQPIRIIGSDERRADVDFERILRAKQIHITITGCCDRQLMREAHKLLREATQSVRVTHFIYTGEEELVRVINAVQPMLYTGFYEAYCLTPGVFSKEREQLYRSNCVYIRWQEEDGWRDQPMLLADKGVFVALRGGRASSPEKMGELYADDIRHMTRLKSQMPCTDGVPDYAAYTDACRRMEKGRAIYSVKLDVPFPLIAPEILVPCALESFSAAGMGAEQAQRMVDALRAIHAARFDNVFQKRKPTHLVLSRAFMERFALTGRQTDHFFALRPYTGAERAAILAHMRTQMLENEHFNVHFFKEDVRPPLMEITLFEGACTLMTKPFTDYNLAGDHAEAVIESPEFCALYKAYFVEDLLARQVTDREESLAELDRLIGIAQNA